MARADIGRYSCWLLERSKASAVLALATAGSCLNGPGSPGSTEARWVGRSPSVLGRSPTGAHLNRQGGGRAHKLDRWRQGGQ